MNTTMRRAALLVLAHMSLAVQAQGPAVFPDRPIRAIVPFAPGGNADINARLLAQALSQGIGQPVVVENKAGASGLLGGAVVAKAPPDGYTALFGTPAPIFASSVLQGSKAPYTMADLQPVARISTVPIVLVVPEASALRTFNDFAVAARRKANAVSVGHAGNGTTNHVAGLQLQRALGTTLLLAPYKGSGLAVQDLLGQQIDAGMIEMPAAHPQIAAGKLRVLAVIGDERVPVAPAAPTARELGLAGVDVLTFAGVMLPKGVPEAIVAKWTAAIGQAVADPAFREQLQKAGVTPAHQGPQVFGEFLKGQEERYRHLVQSGLVQAE